MPKRGKQTKRTRDRAMIAGIRKHREQFPANRGDDPMDVDRLVAMLEAHLATLADVDRYDAMKRDAVALERAQEKALLPLYNRVAEYARNFMGKGSPHLVDFGVKPQAPVALSNEKKLVAAAKRRATRAKRRTMGRKQKKKIRGW